MKLIQKNSAFSLRNRYIPALLLVAIFASFAYINVEQIIDSIEKDAKVINTSGRQRMLSQNLILLGLKYLDHPNEKNRSLLQKNIKLMKTTHHNLITNHNNNKLDKIYTDKKLSLKLNNFLLKFNLFLKSPTEEKITKLSYDAQILLPLLSKVVKEYENINTLKVNHLHQKQLLILIAIIILLLFEIIFVFYPASKKIKNHTEVIEIFNTNLEEKVKEEIKKNRDKEKHLIQQSKLAQMGEMIDMIAHQWRQPLSAISSLNSTIELQATLDSLEKNQTIKYTNKISTLIQHLSKTIDDFRNFFKQNKEKESFSCDALLESTIVITENSLKIHNINLIKDLNCTCNFKTYVSELKQVILNLIKNAEDALVDNNVKNPYIKISTLTKDGKYTLEVSDNAGGIAKENINRIFDPYFSTKIKKNGTGLGLYMSKTIIEEHCEGSLSVFNSKDGAVFKITLPIS